MLKTATKLSLMGRAMGTITGRPDTSLATKTGAPIMTAMRPPVPVSVPAVAAGTVTPTDGTGVSDVSVGVAGSSNALDAGKDARLSSQNGVVTAEGSGTGEQKASLSSNGQSTAGSSAAPPPSNHVATAKQIKEYQKLQLKAQQKAARDAKKKGAAAPAVNAKPVTENGTPATPETGAQTSQPASRTTPPQPTAPPQ